MKVSKEFKTKYDGVIQIAKSINGGNSSWGIKQGKKDDSIRLAWYNEEGGFDPISSAEVPLWGLIEMIKVAAENEMFTVAQTKELICTLVNAINTK